MGGQYTPQMHPDVAERVLAEICQAGSCRWLEDESVAMKPKRANGAAAKNVEDAEDVVESEGVAHCVRE